MNKRRHPRAEQLSDQVEDASRTRETILAVHVAEDGQIWIGSYGSEAVTKAAIVLMLRFLKMDVLDIAALDRKSNQELQHQLKVPEGMKPVVNDDILEVGEFDDDDF